MSGTYLNAISQTNDSFHTLLSSSLPSPRYSACGISVCAVALSFVPAVSFSWSFSNLFFGAGEFTYGAEKSNIYRSYVFSVIVWDDFVSQGDDEDDPQKLLCMFCNTNTKTHKEESSIAKTRLAWVVEHCRPHGARETTHAAHVACGTTLAYEVVWVFCGVVGYSGLMAV